MILSYSFPQFEQLILDGDKIHTFRRDTARRWKPGRHIDHYMGSPRNPRSNPRKFAEGECKAVQEVSILRVKGTHKYSLADKKGVPLFEKDLHEIVIEIDNRIFIDEECLPIIKNDGLTEGEFYDFFVPHPIDFRDYESQGLSQDMIYEELRFRKRIWNGRLIHWTEKLY